MIQIFSALIFSLLCCSAAHAGQAISCPVGDRSVEFGTPECDAELERRLANDWAVFQQDANGQTWKVMDYVFTKEQCEGLVEIENITLHASGAYRYCVHNPIK